MEQAVEAVIDQEIDYGKAAWYVNLPRATPEMYMTKRKKDKNNFKVDKSAGKFKHVFEN